MGGPRRDGENAYSRTAIDRQPCSCLNSSAHAEEGTGVTAMPEITPDAAGRQCRDLGEAGEGRRRPLARTGGRALGAR